MELFYEDVEVKDEDNNDDEVNEIIIFTMVII